MTSKENAQLMRQIIFIAKAHHSAIENRVSSLGMHRSANMILSHLFAIQSINNDSIPSQKEIAKKFKVSEAAVASALDRLEKDGYIARVPVKEDRRKNKISLTQSGIKIVQETKDIFNEIDEKTFSGLDDSQKEQLMSLLEIVSNNLSGETLSCCDLDKEKDK